MNQLYRASLICESIVRSYAKCSISHRQICGTKFLSKFLGKPHGLCQSNRTFSLSSSKLQKERSSDQETKGKPPYVLVLVGAYVFVVGLLYAREKRKPPKEIPAIQERLNDPRMKGKDADAIKHDGFWLPISLVKGKGTLESIENFKARDDDIYVVSFPKSGTTWAQQIVYLLLNDDESHEQDATLEDRFPYLEFIYPGLKEIDKRPSPRLIKSHLPFQFIPAQVRAGKSRVIYIARNPKDVAVSYYHFVKMLTVANYQGSFSEFYDAFIQGRVNYGPWDEHVKSFWSHRQDSNILFITYEDLQEDLQSAICRIGDFLNRPVSQKRAEDLAKRCTFDAMKSNPATNYSWWDSAGIRKTSEAQFMRKGKVADWKNYMNTDMAVQMDSLCKVSLEPVGLVFKDDAT